MLNSKHLNILINQSPEKECPQEHTTETMVIYVLNKFGQDIGYGALAQLANAIRDAQVYGEIKSVVELKAERFAGMEWTLPEEFDDLIDEIKEWLKTHNPMTQNFSE